jgi:hypothetical protein
MSSVPSGAPILIGELAAAFANDDRMRDAYVRLVIAGEREIYAVDAARRPDYPLERATTAILAKDLAHRITSSGNYRADQPATIAVDGGYAGVYAFGFATSPEMRQLVGRPDELVGNKGVILYAARYPQGFNPAA